MEAPDIGIAVAAGGTDEAYARPSLAAGKAQYKIVEERIVRLHRESTATQRHDMLHWSNTSLLPISELICKVSIGISHWG
jgi:hypothetical protein